MYEARNHFQVILDPAAVQGWHRVLLGKGIVCLLASDIAVFIFIFWKGHIWMFSWTCTLEAHCADYMMRRSQASVLRLLCFVGSGHGDGSMRNYSPCCVMFLINTNALAELKEQFKPLQNLFHINHN